MEVKEKELKLQSTGAFTLQMLEVSLFFFSFITCIDYCQDKFLAVK